MPMFDLLFSFSGRIGRKSWWIGLLIGLLANLVGAVLIDPMLFSAEVARPASPALALWDIAWVIPMTAITVKRFNDRDWPNWLGYAVGVAAVALIVAEQAGYVFRLENASIAELAASLVLTVAMLFAFIDNAFIKGTPGPNRYGPEQPTVSPL